jgi:hypothetical protein
VAKKKEQVVTLNDGRRYHITGNVIRGYNVQDSHDEGHIVFRSENVQDCYTWREKHDKWEMDQWKRSVHDANR